MSDAPLPAAAPRPGPGRVVVIVPARDCERTLGTVVRAIPAGSFDGIIVGDNGSRDRTAAIAESLGLRVLSHPRDLGYGGNQKALLRAALADGADVVAMLHGDGQYDPRRLPAVVEPILRGEADTSIGSRMLGGNAWRQGMPLLRYVVNRIVTGIENRATGASVAEAHTGYRAYARRLLAEIPWESFSDDFLFDSEMHLWALAAGMRMAEVPIPTRYTGDSSSVGLAGGVRYVRGTLRRVRKLKRGRWGPRARP